MTHEEKLKAIIEARKELNEFEFGFEEVKIGDLGKGFWCHNAEGEGCYEPSILEYLLRTEGCKAAYGSELMESCSHDFSAKREEEIDTSVFNADSAWIVISRETLDAWHSGGWKAAIDTAYDMLPNECQQSN